MLWQVKYGHKTFATSSLKKQSWFSHPMNLAGFMTCFDQENVPKVMLCKFQNQGLAHVKCCPAATIL